MPGENSKKRASVLCVAFGRSRKLTDIYIYGIKNLFGQSTGPKQIVKWKWTSENRCYIHTQTHIYIYRTTIRNCDLAKFIRWLKHHRFVNRKNLFYVQILSFYISSSTHIQFPEINTIIYKHYIHIKFSWQTCSIFNLIIYKIKST